MESPPLIPRPWRTLLPALAGCGVSAVWLASIADDRVADPTVLMLTGCAAVANLVSVERRAGLWISGSFVFGILGVVLLGPAAGTVVAVGGELIAWTVERYRATAVVINVAATALPTLAAGELYELLAGSGVSDSAAVVALSPVVALALVLNFGIVGGLTALEAGDASRLRPPRGIAMALTWSMAMTIVLATVFRYHSDALGVATLVLAGLGVVYMLRLAATSGREGERRAVSSLHLIDSLGRTLQGRNVEAARHAAAVACYARDIARISGLTERECEHAHLAGLLHDVGKVALSDRAVDGGTGLSHGDWVSIAHHPEIGAGMVEPLGAVAAAVRHHHERVDGRGYPDGLSDDEIPVLARIVAVAEVYDTLTAEGSYRDTMSSFQALCELRRVSATQLDEQFVEALAQLLGGQTTDYRYATAANLESELAVERRLMATAAG